MLNCWSKYTVLCPNTFKNILSTISELELEPEYFSFFVYFRALKHILERHARLFTILPGAS